MDNLNILNEVQHGWVSTILYQRWADSYRVRFMADGSVQGSKGGAWGVLLTAKQAQEHLRTRGLA
jgi:hypothetical protein